MAMEKSFQLDDGGHLYFPSIYLDRSVRWQYMKKILKDTGYWDGPDTPVDALEAAETSVGDISPVKLDRMCKVVKEALRKVGPMKIPEIVNQEYDWLGLKDVSYGTQDYYNHLSETAEIGGLTHIDEVLKGYHYGRFLHHGEIVYKVRKAKAEILNDAKIDVPGDLMVLPFKEFMISLPFGTITTQFGSMLNIFVGEEEFDEEYYDGNVAEFDKPIKDLLAQKKDDILKVIRVYVLYMKKERTNFIKSFFYQMPITDGSITAQQEFLAERCTTQGGHRDEFRAVFKFVLAFCCYLCTPDPDIQKVLGVKKEIRPASSDKKNRRKLQYNRIYSHNYYDVGRITDKRIQQVGDARGDGSVEIAAHRVRAHIRAQWYGKRQETKPGKYQSLIYIDSFVKGTKNLERLQERRDTVVG